MKKVLILSILCIHFLVGCNNKEKPSAEKESQKSADTVQAMNLISQSINPQQVNDIANNFDIFYKSANLGADLVTFDDSEIIVQDLLYKIAINSNQDHIGFAYGMEITGSPASKKMIYLLCIATTNSVFTLKPLENNSGLKYLVIKNNQLVNITNENAESLITNYGQNMKLFNNSFQKVTLSSFYPFSYFCFYEMKDFKALLVDNGMDVNSPTSITEKLIIKNGARIQMNATSFYAYKAQTPFLYIKNKLAPEQVNPNMKYNYRALDFGELAPPPPVNK